MSDFTLTCSVQPLSGEPCPAGQGEWVSSAQISYENWRDIIFGMPLEGDISTVFLVTTAIAVTLNLPVIVDRLLGVVERYGLR